MKTDWHKRFILLARHVSTWSKDPSTRVGAVAVDQNRNVVSMGYNGFPMGILDSLDRLNDREIKYKYTVHAEKNVIYNAGRNGVSLAGASLYVWGLPICSECMKGIIQSGITNVYIPIVEGVPIPDKWKKSWQVSYEMCIDTGIKVTEVFINKDE